MSLTGTKVDHIIKPQVLLLILLCIGLQLFVIIGTTYLYDWFSDDWFFDFLYTPAKPAFPRTCASSIEHFHGAEMRIHRARPQCMRAWVDHDRTHRPDGVGFALATISKKLEDIKPRVKNQYQLDRNMSSLGAVNTIDNSHLRENSPTRTDSTDLTTKQSYCNILPNAVILSARTDPHFPHFAASYFKFISFALLAYESLGEYYEACGYSMQHLLIDEKESFRFWRAEAHRNQWVYDLVRAVDNKWKAHTVSPASCAKTSNSMYTSSSSSSVGDEQLALSTPSVVYQPVVHTDWFDSMSWFAHGSDALYVGSILRHSDPCELLGQSATLLKKPLNLLVLNRRDDRRLANVDEIISSVANVAKQLSITIHPLHNNDTLHNSHPNEFLFEGTSLHDQVATMYSSDIIITTHGAAETNLAWLKPCSIVLEVYGYPFFELYFKGLAESLQLVHYWWQEPAEHVEPTTTPIGSTDCKRERIISGIVEQVEKEFHTATVTEAGVSGTGSETLSSHNQLLHILTPNFGQTEYYSANTATNKTSVLDSIITQRCMHDAKCRSCARGNKKIMVSTTYLQAILARAIQERERCIKTHPFYIHL